MSSRLPRAGGDDACLVAGDVRDDVCRCRRRAPAPAGTVVVSAASDDKLDEAMLSRRGPKGRAAS